MKKLRHLLILLGLGILNAVAQPVMTNGAVELNFDEVGNSELRYGTSASFMGAMPDLWMVGFAIEPVGSSRLLRKSPQRVKCLLGDSVSASLVEYQKGGHFSLGLLSYSAVSYDGGATWEYQTLTAAFEKESELLLGLKLALPTGTHYGWIKLTRPSVDLYTPFTIAGYAYHPVPDQPIGAGEAAPPPPLQSSVGDDGSLNFTWDTSLGEVVLEWTDSLDQPNWQPVPDASAPPVMLLPGEGHRFYRLRRP